MADEIPQEVTAFYEAIRLTFSSTHGREVLNDLRKSFSYRAMNEGDLDPLRLAYREGQRSVLLKIEALLSKAQELAEAAASKKPGKTHAEME